MVLRVDHVQAQGAQIPWLQVLAAIVPRLEEVPGAGPTDRQHEAAAPQGPCCSGPPDTGWSVSEARGLGDTLRDTPCASPPFSGRPPPPPTESLPREGPPPGPPRSLQGGSPHGRSLWADHRATDSEGGCGSGRDGQGREQGRRLQ